MLVIEQDLKRLREIYNNVLVFFEVINSDADVIFWAFLKLFSTNFVNVDDKFQLQFFEHQKVSPNMFMSTLRHSKSQSDLSIFEQWRLPKRKKFLGTLNISLKCLNPKQEIVPAE